MQTGLKSIFAQPFRKLIRIRRFRRFQSTEVPEKCWKCEKSFAGGKFCESCQTIQPVIEKNLFNYVGVPLSFNVDLAALKKNFRDLQSSVHPDKFAQASEQEKNYSEEHSRKLNEAYKTLTEPMKRAKYMFELMGGKSKEKGDLDQEALMEMMERNEEISEITDKERLKEEEKKVGDEIQAKLKDLDTFFGEKNIDGVSQSITQLSYLYSLRNAIQKRLNPGFT
ncbi:unnamed protein product [Caenorhabditis auriculariae]|uniref:J domain-containing protein n=1 Tax=Caenorhabditis auriculariae TaxID=2777116 RepID=A0A8S1H877_9PELO|nr:unnamed protein product [Caenorhabditis auriculariae]